MGVVTPRLPARTRLAVSVALAAALLVGTSACTLFSINGTLKHYEPSDGAGANVGDLKFRNVLGLSDDGTDVALVLTIVNEGKESQIVDFQFDDADGDKQTMSVTVQGNSSLPIGQTADHQFVLRDVDTTVGGLLPVFVQYGKVPGKQIQVPVLDGTTVAYTDLLPSPAPVIKPTGTATPAPTETPAP